MLNTIKMNCTILGVVPTECHENHGFLLGNCFTFFSDQLNPEKRSKLAAGCLCMKVTVEELIEDIVVQRTLN